MNKYDKTLTQPKLIDYVINSNNDIEYNYENNLKKVQSRNLIMS